MRRAKIVVASLLTLVWPAWGQVLEKTDHIVDRVSYKIGSETAQGLLIVAENDAIRTLAIDGRAKPVASHHLGYRVTRSGNVNLDKLLPRQRVASFARRFRIAEDKWVHAVIAWGFAKRGDPEVTYRVFVFLEDRKGGTTRQTYASDDVNVTLEQAHFLDVTGDKLPELLDMGRSAKIGDLFIRFIGRDGTVSHSQQFDAYDFSLHEPRQWGEAHVMTLVADERPCTNGVNTRCSISNELRWSPQSKKFVQF